MVNYTNSHLSGSARPHLTSNHHDLETATINHMLSTQPLSLQSATAALLSWVERKLSNPTESLKVSRATIPIRYEFDSLLTWLGIQFCQEKLFFNCRDGSFEIAAIGFAYRASGPCYNEKVHQELSNLLDDSDPYMRFYGGCRFDDSNQSRKDPAWYPYSGYTFVLPQIELYRVGANAHFLAANFNPSDSRSNQLPSLLRHLAVPTLSSQASNPSLFIPPTKLVTEIVSFPEWDNSMSTILDQLTRKQYEKVVLSRAKMFQYDPSNVPDPVHIIAYLEKLYRKSSNVDHNSAHSPVYNESIANLNRSREKQNLRPTHGSYIFLLQLDDNQAFLGCPPERLFRVEDDDVFTEALAGTVKRTPSENDEEQLSELLGKKNLEEHAFVVDSVKKALDISGVSVETNGPNIRRLPRLMHLSTDIRGKFMQCSTRRSTEGIDMNNRSSVLEQKDRVYTLLKNMHPTAAVCGLPRKESKQALRDLENFDRGFFTGPFGWFSQRAGEFCVAIRSALVQEHAVTAYAGSGIVSASESRSEWDETELKMSTYTDLFLNKTHLQTKDQSSFRGGVVKVNGNNSPKDSLPINVLANGSARLLAVNHITDSTNNIESLSMREIPILGKTSFPSRRLDHNIAHTSNGEVTTAPLADDTKFFDSRYLEDSPNLNTLWGCCCIEELCRNGVTTFFVAPGSRSAPLAIGATCSKHSQLYIAHDERGAGFLACGYARATGRAAAIITSSGTAVANLLPAVVEAFSDNLPIILLTADRPPELRDIGANQTIRQVGIFSHYTLWMKDLPCPSMEVPLGSLLGDIDYAVFMSGSASPLIQERAKGRRRGPVHLNMMFREKLAPDEQEWDRKYLSDVNSHWRNSLSPLCSYSTFGSHSLFYDSSNEMNAGLTPHFGKILQKLFAKGKGLILIGGGSGSVSSRNDALAINEMAKALNWPIISDVCGGLRFDASSDMVCHYGDLIYGSELAHKSLIPEAVLQIGERITSKRICKLLSSSSVSEKNDRMIHLVVSPSTNRCDPCSSVTHRVVCEVADIIAYVGIWKKNLKNRFHYNANGNGCNSSLYPHSFKESCRWMNPLRILIEISSKIDELLSSFFGEQRNESDPRLSEPLCARIVSENMDHIGGVLIGNSMPIRDLNIFSSATANGSRIHVAANRGASGIDGLISTGIGFSVGLKKDVAIMLGDMSTLHDLNALHLLRREENVLANNVTVIVVNNGGGGIFSMLPVAKHQNVFSPVFDTPHSIRMQGAAEMFEMEYSSVCTAVELCRVLQQKPNCHRLVEIFIDMDHESNATLHRHLSQMIADEVTKMLMDSFEVADPPGE